MSAMQWRRIDSGRAGSHAQRFSERGLFSGDRTRGQLKHALTVAASLKELTREVNWAIIAMK